MADKAEMTELKALIFDVDGTLADTEELHREAFNQAFQEFGVPWAWTPATYERLLTVSGGKERIDFYMHERLAAGRGEVLSAAFINRLHSRKTAIYGELLRAGRLSLRPGVERLLLEARAAGIKLGIATSSARANLEALLDINLQTTWRDWFDAVETCESTPAKKPSPAAYSNVLHGLGLPSTDCVAIEDTVNGLHSANGAGILTIITTHRFTRARRFPGALVVADGLGEPDLPCSVTQGSLYGSRYIDLACIRNLLAMAHRAQASNTRQRNLRQESEPLNAAI